MSLLGPVVEPGPRRRPAEPQIVGSNPTRPATSPPDLSLCPTSSKRTTIPDSCRFTCILFYIFRATMLYAQTRDLLYVMKILGHRSITNTIRYTQLVDFKDGESFICKVAKSADDAVKLVESGFEFASSFPDLIQLYKKRK